ncbi:hypothetical protein H6G93_20580 [Nostoc sp. FACHB-973]|nr:hypothetical protein [Nostoc sp. FACHB-973]
MNSQFVCGSGEWRDKGDEGVWGEKLLTPHRLNAPLPLTALPMPNAQCPILLSLRDAVPTATLGDGRRSLLPRRDTLSTSVLCPMTNCYEAKVSTLWTLAVHWNFAPGQLSIFGYHEALWQPPIAPKRHQAINANLRLVCTRSLKYQKTRDEA